MCNLNLYFERFAGKPLGGAVRMGEVYDELLESEGFVCEDYKRGECMTCFYYHPEKENVFAYTKNSKGESLSVILPKVFVEKYYMKDGKFKRIIRLNHGGYLGTSLSVVVDTAKGQNRKVSRVLLEEFYGVNIDDLEVDHIFSHRGVNIFDSLRACTSKQNMANKRNRKNVEDDEFKYNELRDFRDSIYIPLLHFVLGKITEEDMYELRKMEIERGV